MFREGSIGERLSLNGFFNGSLDLGICGLHMRERERERESKSKSKSKSFETTKPGRMDGTKQHTHTHLVGGFNPSEKNSQLGWLFPIYGKIKNVPNYQPDTHTHIYIYIYNSTIYTAFIETISHWSLPFGFMSASPSCRGSDRVHSLVNNYGPRQLQLVYSH